MVSIQGNLCFIQSGLKFSLSDWFSINSVSQFRTKLSLIKAVAGCLALSKSWLKSLNFPIFGETLVQNTFFQIRTRNYLCFDICRILESIMIQKEHVMFRLMVSYATVIFGWLNDTVLWALTPQEKTCLPVGIGGRRWMSLVCSSLLGCITFSVCEA